MSYYFDIPLIMCVIASFTPFKSLQSQLFFYALCFNYPLLPKAVFLGAPQGQPNPLPQ